ncbi:ER membrane protein complex subunit 4 [Mycena chlorophos]|uniref:ER membrane protein complex subunit 4 n=1 Tax=Mycena chlorophos TaxID=658473 RepID=A0A8H6TUW2_MYCCL|nr:ER membrane protein complex subunit 4 [Mycena chlorophos]
MQAFMLYMSGSGVQIFSIGIVFMLLLSPFKNVAGMNQAFAQFAPSTASNPKSLLTLPWPKLVYVFFNVLTLAVGLWKCRTMGLLPVGTGDWLAFETRGTVRNNVSLLFVGAESLFRHQRSSYSSLQDTIE